MAKGVTAACTVGMGILVSAVSGYVGRTEPPVPLWAFGLVGGFAILMVVLPTLFRNGNDR
jgi:hypothetical protein